MALSWTGTLIDTAALRERVAAEIREEGEDPSDISVELRAAEVTVTPDVRLPLEAAGLSLGQIPLFEVAGTGAAAWVKEPHTFPLPDVAVQHLNRSYATGTPVVGSGHAAVAVVPGQVARPARAEPVVFRLDLRVTVAVSKRIL